MSYKPLGIVDTMPFGQHKGRGIGELIDEEPAYMYWLLNARNAGFFDKETERLIERAHADL